ncbi:hypothetical protein DL98DRAFT_587348 [Cadophora sp. DSE1049]|nr:hypothetical protein DL98DRAFT_587348 [Cadophora sp. DSE1049]
MHFAPYGRFRGICKLFMHFDTTPTVFIGTGWVIDANTVVKAAHWVLPSYDNAIHILSSIEVYCGYDGQDSKGNPKVDYRYGTRVTVPHRYWMSLTARHDVAMITMDRALPRYVTPLPYKNTPPAGSCPIAIPGYPADKEGGHRMYIDEKHIAWHDLPGGLFRHKVNTYKGQSGSPILAFDDDNDPYACQVIAVHTQSGNSGTCIGHAENNFDILLASLQYGPAS